MHGLAVAPRPVRGLVDEGALAGALHAPPLPVGGLSLRKATGAVGFARALSVTTRGLEESACTLLAAMGPVLIVRGQMVEWKQMCIIK